MTNEYAIPLHKEEEEHLHLLKAKKVIQGKP
jgi:hypothetical protein